jgi:serine/threonine protein kinase
MNTMDRWQQIEDIFHATLESAPGERDSFVAAACGADADMRARVEALLRAHEMAENPLDSTPLEMAAGLPFGEANSVAGGSVIGHYQIVAPLGQGGMGAVYLAMHLGTRRYVALKVIAPQLMAQPEFVTRFRREAEAAGRLRHPNVVDVTDFGFARLGAADIAYLVMEYLDGCSLADILAEEGGLPLMWAVDILEQVCSAVHEAHQQGTVHRDLKPENIWLEPNRRGGYTVKVLDFGLAKLAPSSTPHSLVEAKRHQIGSDDSACVVPPSPNPPLPADSHPPQTCLGEATTLLLPKVSEEAATLALPRAPVTKGSGIYGRAAHEALSAATSDGLTRIGSLMGTPLYMSPEQCRGQIPGAQSDIYSLGVIAYQMLSGRTPFRGEMDAVIRSHIEAPPTPLREANPKTPKKIAALIMSALAKDPAARPPSAAAFASALRARAEGTGTLWRRTFALCSEHFPTFLRISVISYLPWLALLLLRFGNDLLIHTGVMPSGAAQPVNITLRVLSDFISVLCNVIIMGVIVPIIIQLIVAPLRPIQIRAAFAVLRRRLRPFITTAMLVLLLSFGGFVLFVLPFFVVAVLYALYPPIVIVENLKNWAALRRSQTLVRRAPGTAILIVLVQFAIPTVIALILGENSASFIVESPDFGARLLGRLTALLNILLLPLITISTVLLYLKTRQAGGETIKETLAQFEEEEAPRRKWQMRMRERLPMLDRPGSQT